MQEKALGTEKRPQVPSDVREKDLFAEGYVRIAGCDEAGRGPLAGPVVAAAVVLPPKLEPHILHGVRDSKQLTEHQREHFYRILIESAEAYSVGTATPKEIDEINILRASLLAMKRAVERLSPPADYVLVDGNKTPELGGIPVEAVVGGDRHSVTIASASIIAKVVRDRIMGSYHQQFPQYDFDSHKGYPTPYHRAAIEVFGTSQIHRHTFAGVAEHILSPSPSVTFERLYKRLAARLTRERLEKILEELETSRGTMSEAEHFVIRYRCRHLMEEFKKQAIDVRRSTHEIGQAKEETAAQYLLGKGYKIWERNFRLRRGEIDIIANRGNQVVIVEVKMRTSETFGQPFEAVTKRKQQTLIRLAEAYLAQRGLLQDWNVRFDVISILEEEGRPSEIQHIEDAFRPE